MPAFSCAIEPSQLFEKRCLYVIFFFPHSYLFLAGRRKIPDSIRQIAMQGEFDEFDLNVFFSAKAEKNKPESAKFVYESEVQKWLDLIRGAYLPSNVDDLKLGQDKRPPMPFSDVRLMNVLTHTLWFLPNVASCYAMYNLLMQKQNNFYHELWTATYTIGCPFTLTKKDKP